jgi:ribonucleoside-diphosphate reductase alpha chain
MSIEFPRGLSEPAFDPNAMRVLNERYLAKKPDGSTETPTEFLWRVASAIATSERTYAERAGRDADAVVDNVAQAFYEMLARRDFMPNTPCLVNAGRPLSMLSACFVLPVPDSIDRIFYNLQAMALIQKSGGGTGFAFSDLRHHGSEVQSTGKEASGPVSFMKVFNSATDSIKQGGVRRGANMGVLRIDHPDVFHFMHCKKELDAENRALFNRMSDTGRYTDAQLSHIKQELLQTQMNNFNISIGVTDAFMSAVETDSDFDLIDPRTKQAVQTVKARDIWDGIVEGAWQNGEPGVLFLDHPDVNALPGLGPIEATNPCVTADTWVLTDTGVRRVSDLVGMPFDAIVNGKAYPTLSPGFFSSGVSEVFRVETAGGQSVKLTANHKVMVHRERGDAEWVEIGQCVPGDRLMLHEHAGFAWQGAGTHSEGWLLGSLVADDQIGAGVARLDSWDADARELASAVHKGSANGAAPQFAADHATLVADRAAPGLESLALSYGVFRGVRRVSPRIESTSSEFHRGFLRGLFDADGYIQYPAAVDKGVNIRLSSSDIESLSGVQRMLGRLGIISRMCPDRRDMQRRKPAESRGRHAERASLAQHELSIGRKYFRLFADLIGFTQVKKAEQLQTALAGEDRVESTLPGTKLVALIPLGPQPVFDCTVSDVHAFDANGFYVSNCGEQFLHGYDSCNLGSINVGHFYDSSKNDVDWNRLAAAVNLSIRFLDNVIDANIYPIDEIKEMVTSNRRVGLGIMGFADLLIQLRIAYGSPQAVALAEELMKFMQTRAEDTSEILARERGEFPNKHLSKWADDPRPRRNAALLSIAPTGTISMIAGCSFGCEPYFGIAYTKHVMKDAEGRPQHLYYVLPLFEEIAKDEGFYSEALLAKVEEKRGSLKGIPEVPALWQEVFTVAADVSVDQHIDMLAAFQKHTCNAVSKTINAPNDDTRENVARSIFRAYKSGCKGFTYYRDGSRTEQVVTFSKDADISGVNRDAGENKSESALTAAAAIVKNVSTEDPLEALLARAQTLLGENSRG